MPWVKLDDQFTDHPKVVEAGPLAAWLYVCGLTYCARQLTDGFIPDGQVRRLLPSGSVGKLAQRLVEVHLWEPAPGGYRVHDFLIYNATREQTLALRQQRASAGRKGGWQKASKVLEVRQPVATTPVPVPNPVPHEASTQTEDLHKKETAGAGAAVVEHARVFAVPKPGLPPGSPQVALIGAFASAAGYAEPTTKSSRAKWIDGAQELLHATPPVTADEIPGLVERYREENTVPVTLPGIAGQLPQLRSPHVASRPQNGWHESARAQLDRVFGGTT